MRLIHAPRLREKARLLHARDVALRDMPRRYTLMPPRHATPRVAALSRPTAIYAMLFLRL